jgi:hypothetical protein
LVVEALSFSAAEGYVNISMEGKACFGIQHEFAHLNINLHTFLVYLEDMCDSVAAVRSNVNESFTKIKHLKAVLFTTGRDYCIRGR